jgi:hypothetical protein
MQAIFFAAYSRVAGASAAAPLAIAKAIEIL